MARPLKQGVDYFPLDVHDDDKLKFIRIKYKVVGVAIVFELYRRIYSQGFWCKWSDDEALIFSDDIKADYDTVISVIEECFKRAIFSKEKYDTHNILTSKGIQDRYKEICKRRKDLNIVDKYVINDSILNTECKHDVDINGVNVDINGVNVDTMYTEVHKEKEIKLKETEIKEKVEDNTSASSDASDNISMEFHEFWSSYDKKIDRKKVESKYKKLSKADREAIREHLPKYIAATPDKQFRKNPYTYLNGRVWNDEELPVNRSIKPTTLDRQREREFTKTSEELNDTIQSLLL